MFYRFCLYGAWIIWHTLYRFRVIGRENRPRQHGYILIANHVCATDVVFLLLARCSPRRPMVFAKEELFASPLLSRVLRGMGAVPVSRGKGDRTLLEKAAAALRAGRDVVIFPEGTRSRTGTLGVLKSGAFAVAAMADAPIVVCRILYENGRPQLFRRVRVAVGQTFSAAQLGLNGADGAMPPASVLRRAKAICVRELERLENENAPTVQKGARRKERA